MRGDGEEGCRDGHGQKCHQEYKKSLDVMRLVECQVISNRARQRGGNGPIEGRGTVDLPVSEG